jgi:hypothetical protein
MNDSKQLIRDVIQRIYGDAAQTALDDRAASEIISALREIGWAAPEDTALLIKAAGGRIVVTRDLQEEFGRNWQIERWDDPLTDSMTVRVRESAT